jgi:hypothetical protein
MSGGRARCACPFRLIPSRAGRGRKGQPLPPSPPLPLATHARTHAHTHTHTPPPTPIPPKKKKKKRHRYPNLAWLLGEPLPSHGPSSRPLRFLLLPPPLRRAPTPCGLSAKLCGVVDRVVVVVVIVPLLSSPFCRPLLGRIPKKMCGWVRVSLSCGCGLSYALLEKQNHIYVYNIYCISPPRRRLT